MKKFFNAETTTGRANVAKATYGSFALLYLYYRIRKGFSKSDDPQQNPSVVIAEGVDQNSPQNCPCRDRIATGSSREAKDQQPQCSSYTGGDLEQHVSQPTKVESACTPARSNMPPSLVPPAAAGSPNLSGQVPAEKCQMKLCLSPDTPLPPPTTDAIRAARVRAQETRIKAEAAIAEAETARAEVIAIAKAEAETATASRRSTGSSGAGGSQSSKSSCFDRREAARIAAAKAACAANQSEAQKAAPPLNKTGTQTPACVDNPQPNANATLPNEGNAFGLTTTEATVNKTKLDDDSEMHFNMSPTDFSY